MSNTKSNSEEGNVLPKDKGQTCDDQKKKESICLIWYHAYVKKRKIRHHTHTQTQGSTVSFVEVRLWKEVPLHRATKL